MSLATLSKAIKTLAGAPPASIDEVAQLSALAGQLDAIVSEAKGAIKAELISAGKHDMAGKAFRAVLSESVRATIDTKALKADLPEIAKRYERSQTVQSLTFKASGAAI